MIGGDEFHSLSKNLHLTSARNLLVYPSEGLGSTGAFVYVTGFTELTGLKPGLIGGSAAAFFRTWS
jgi:hypothetical protein